MRDGFRASRHVRAVALATLAVLLGVAAGWFVARGDVSSTPGAQSAQSAPPATAEGPQPDLERSALDAVRGRIAAPGASAATDAVTQAQPLSTQPNTVAQAAQGPVPPDGFSFSAAPTAMSYRPYRPPPADDALPDDGLDWLHTDASASTHTSIIRKADEAQRDWVFGWLRLAPGADARSASEALAPLHVEVLAESGPLLRAKLPADAARLAAALGLGAVAGIGVLPAARKAPADFAARVRDAPSQQTPVLITLMENDADGRWRRALQDHGAVVGRFDADIRAYVAEVDAAALDALVEADFVLAVEPVRTFQAAHDTAVPAMGADAVRSHANAPGRFLGATGASTPIGVMDTGLNTNHPDIATHRLSICGASFFEESHVQRIEDADLWVDQDGHGTHVTGTIAGNGFAEAKYAGMAPGVAHIRFAKVLSRYGYGYSDGIFRGMDYLARPSACSTASQPVKPLVVNMSLSDRSREFEGRTAEERKLDAVVWAHRQLYVVAQANASIYGFSDFGAAKNSLSVGAIHDSGELASFSSWGPTFDGRLAPQVVATGMDVYSARGNGSPGGYVSYDGTSMASPSVAGVAALLMDAVPSYREQPALIRARLMASAVKPDAWLDAPRAFPATNSDGPGFLQNQYGLGKASARTSVLQRRRGDGWMHGAAVLTLRDDSYGFRDIVVSEGASRLDIVLAWDEPPTDTIRSAVLNDLDLWLDEGGDCAEAACGEHSSTSRRDNVEWIIVKNPAPGAYRVRVVPHRVYTAAPRAGLAWTIVRGASTPNLRLEVDEVREIDERLFRVTLSLSVDAYVAAGVQIVEEACRFEEGRVPGALNNSCSPTSRISRVVAEDGVEYSPSRLASATTAVNFAWLGEVGVGERQRVEYDVDMSGSPSASRLYFTASAWNAHPATASAPIPQAPDLVDPGQPPAEAASPANDDFAAAETLDGATGSLASDLLAATFEPAEPLREIAGGTKRPSGSVWYRWQAPADGAVHFRVTPLPNSGVTGEVGNVDVMYGSQENGIAGLTRLASAKASVSFFAEQGETYWIRVVQDFPSSHRFMLRWSQGRPVNDDFAAAVRLQGAEGEVEGHNVGATLQQQERVGNFAATVWYRWTAPAVPAGEESAWRFATDRGDNDSRVLVFEGASLAALRLVSGYPTEEALVPVQAGVQYRIAVAARDAFEVGRDFRLAWAPVERETDNDDFANAAELTGAPGSQWVETGNSVEPGEPAGSGVRTRWWSWTAPASGRFVWRLPATTTANELLVAVFAPSEADAPADAEPALADLQLVASTGPRVTGSELGFDAVEGRRYWVSVGFHSGDIEAFSADPGGATLSWGEAPANDVLAEAAPLVGSSGSLTASNQWSTLEPGEPSGVLGHSSLWWEFTPDAAGWYRFQVDDALSGTLGVYRRRSAEALPQLRGFDGLELVARSRGGWRSPEEEEAVAVLFHAVAGERYLIRVGSHGNDGGHMGTGGWTLHWAQAEAPTWLRYVGRLRASALGLENEDPDASAAMAFEDLGAALYLGSSQGLHVLRRDEDAGTLAPVRVVAMERPEALLWNAHRTRLYAFADCAWRQLAPSGESRMALRDEGALAVSGEDEPHCEVRRTFLDPSGAFLHHVHGAGLAVYAIDDGALTLVQSTDWLDLGDGIQEGFDNIKDALISTDGAFVYVLHGRATLRLFHRDATAGTLTEASEIDLEMGEYSHSEFARIALADADPAGSDDAFLGVLKPDSTVAAYDLSAGGDAPFHVDALQAFEDVIERHWASRDRCSHVAPRLGALALDVFCEESAAFSIALRRTDEASTLAVTDYVANAQADRFNNHIPWFTPQALATSPNGRHVYVYSRGDILIFERVGR